MLILPFLSKGQELIPKRVFEVLSYYQGKFTWEMGRTSESTILRTGESTSTYVLDSLVLQGHEIFHDSNIEQVGYFGYDSKQSKFFSVGIYNIDKGPHLLQDGIFVSDYVIEFKENDSTKVYLTFINIDEHYWTTKSLKEGNWIVNDLKILFKRK